MGAEKRNPVEEKNGTLNGEPPKTPTTDRQSAEAEAEVEGGRCKSARAIFDMFYLRPFVG